MNLKKLFLVFPQRSIWGTPYLIFTYAIYFFETEDLDVASYADDNSPFACSSELNKVLSKLKFEVGKSSIV